MVFLLFCGAAQKKIMLAVSLGTGPRDCLVAEKGAFSEFNRNQQTLSYVFFIKRGNVSRAVIQFQV